MYIILRIFSTITVIQFDFWLSYDVIGLLKMDYEGETTKYCSACFWHVNSVYGAKQDQACA